MVAQCMDPDGRMIPVRNLVDNGRFGCFCLVEKTFWGYYRPIYNSLMIQDMVECDDLVKRENLGWPKDSWDHSSLGPPQPEYGSGKGGLSTMNSAFEDTTKRVVQCMDPVGKMIPVRSRVDADRFECLCLVKKSLWRYSPCWNSLNVKDIVEIEEGDDLMKKESAGQYEDRGPTFQIEDQVDSKVSAEIQIPEIIVKGSISTVQEIDINVQRYSISQKFLDSLNNRKLKSELPPLFEKIREKQQNLYVVTETLKNVEQKTVKNNWKSIFSSKLKSAGINWKHNEQSTLTINSNEVLAYRLEKLFFHKKDVLNLYLNKSKSFPKDSGVGLRSNSSSEDSRNVKEVAEDMVESLQDLTEKQKEDMLNCLTQCIHKDKWLRDLEQRVSEVLYFNTLLDEREEELKFRFLNCLFNETGVVLTERAETIHNFLESLIELCEQRQIVAENLEEGNLHKLKKEVEHLLEQSAEESLEVVIQDSEKKTQVMLYLVVTILLHLSGKCCESA